MYDVVRPYPESRTGSRWSGPAPRRPRHSVQGRVLAGPQDHRLGIKRTMLHPVDRLACVLLHVDGGEKVFVDGMGCSYGVEGDDAWVGDFVHVALSGALFA